MVSDPRLERRVTRLENEALSIFDMIAGIAATQQQHSERLDGIDQRLDGIDERLDGIDQRLDGIDQRLDGIDERLDRMDSRFDGIDTTLLEILRRLPEPA